jgi:hypothetical protein
LIPQVCCRPSITPFCLHWHNCMIYVLVRFHYLICWVNLMVQKWKRIQRMARVDDTRSRDYRVI